MVDARRCPPEPFETAEAYLLGHLSADEALAFEEHYLACPRCVAMLEETERYVMAMTWACARLRGELAGDR